MRRAAPRVVACLIFVGWVASGCGDNVAQSEDQTLSADTQGQDTSGAATDAVTTTDATNPTDAVTDTDAVGPIEGCLQASPLTVGFFVSNPGTVEQKEARLTNCGDVTLTISNVSQEGAAREISLQDQALLIGRVIAPGESVSVTIVYAEMDDALDPATLTIEASADAGIAPLVVRIEVPIWTWSDTCAPSMVTRTDTTFGAVAVTEDDFLYVVGEGAWMMGEVNLRERSLTPVISLDSGPGVELGWIKRNGEDVSARTFYPSSAEHTFNRSTREVSQRELTNEVAPYAYDGALFSLHVGQSGDGCANVCIMRDNQGDAAPVELIDDGDEDFSIHTGAVYFLEGYAYFMTSQSVFNTPGNPALRRMDLRTGAVEVVFAFAGPRVNAWVYAPVRGDSGEVYWLRYEQEIVDAPWLAYIDRHDVATNRTDAGFISGLGRAASALGIHSGYFVWTDAVGVQAARVAQGATPMALATHSSAAFESGAAAFYTVQGSRVFYSLSATPNGARASEIGCVTLAP